MLKRLTLAAAMVLATQMVASAQTVPTNRQVRSPYPHHGVVEANGRCNGISYGTGARRCGSRSGGPVGGISGRN